jgi:hypothetical protein
MPTHPEVSSRFAQSRGRGLLFTTVVVCFDDASEVMQVRVGIGDSGNSRQNREDAIRAARRLVLRFATDESGLPPMQELVEWDDSVVIP